MNNETALLLETLLVIIVSLLVIAYVISELSKGNKTMRNILIVLFTLIALTSFVITNNARSADLTWNDYRSMIEITQRNTGVIGVIVDDAPMINNSTTMENIEQLLKGKHFKPTIINQVFDCSETSRATAVYLRKMGYDPKLCISMNLNTSDERYGTTHVWVVITDEQTGGMLSIETRLKTQSIGEIVSKDTMFEYYRGFIIEVEDYNRIFPHEPAVSDPHSVIEGWTE
jgi:hypothetical protein